MKKRILPLLMASVIGVGTIAGGCGSASSTSTATGSTVTTTDSSADGSGTSTATSSDGTEQIIILGGGALRVSSAAFRQEVEAAQREIRELAGINNDKG